MFAPCGLLLLELMYISYIHIYTYTLHVHMHICTNVIDWQFAHWLQIDRCVLNRFFVSIGAHHVCSMLSTLV